MFALRHKGDSWYWTGSGWTDKIYEVKKLTLNEADDQAKALALIACEHREDKLRQVVDVIPLADALYELEWRAKIKSEFHADELPGNLSHQVDPCPSVDSDATEYHHSACMSQMP